MTTTLYFYSEDLKERYFGASLGEWTRSYTALKEVSYEKIRSIPEPSEYRFENWCIVKSLSEWAETFIDYGVSENSAKKIAKSMVYRNRIESADILNCPLIPLENKEYALLPSIGLLIDAGESIPSLLSLKANKSNKPLSQKGKGLERLIKLMLRSKGFRAERIKKKVKGETYECDVVCIIDDDLFFIESKADFTPNNICGYINLERELKDVAEVQLENSVEYFLKNMQIVRKKLSVGENWRPANVHRIIITSAWLGRKIEHNQAHVIDTGIFSSIIARKAPSFIEVLNSRVSFPLKEQAKYYEGKITAKNFMAIVRDPPAFTNFDITEKADGFRMKVDRLDLSVEQIEVEPLVYDSEDISSFM